MPPTFISQDTLIEQSTTLIEQSHLYVSHILSVVTQFTVPVTAQ